MTNVEFEILVSRLVQLSYDYDPYEAKDTIESEEYALEQVEKLLVEKTGVESLIGFCGEVLESEDETLYAEAEELQQLLSMRLAEMM